jgi:DNA-binding NarL/FixJ family response regulator
MSVRHESDRPFAAVCDEEPIYAEAVGKLLETQLPEIERVACATSTARLLEAASASCFRLVITDLDMPPSDVVETIRQLVEANPDTSVVILTRRDSDRDVAGALAAGARGYILKDATCAEFVASIRAVLAGNLVVPFDLLLPVMRALEPTVEGDNWSRPSEGPALLTAASGTAPAGR